MTIKISLENSLIAEQGIQESLVKLSSYAKTLRAGAIDDLYLEPESSIHLPLDGKIADAVESLISKMAAKPLRYVFLIGIGGSELGAKAACDAFLGFYDSIEPDRAPKMIFLDTLNAVLAEKISKLISDKNIQEDDLLVCLASKSGTTLESVGNAELLFAACRKSGIDMKKRLVIISDSRAKVAQEKNFAAALPIPAMVGGRFSVFSQVGLLPLAAAGFNIRQFIAGAKEIAGSVKENSEIAETAAKLAAVLHYHAAHGRNICDFFMFQPELETFGKWARQLVAESLGKNGSGITPTVSLGTNDLHSAAQLTFGGPRDKMTVFFSSGGEAASLLRFGDDRMLPEIVPDIAGKKVSEIYSAIYEGVKKTYAHEKLPFVEIILPGLTPQSLGALMQFMMIVVMHLGKLLGVNTFDQPQVEMYKEETRKLIKK